MGLITPPKTTTGIPGGGLLNFLNQPTSLLGLSVLSDAGHPAQALLAGLQYQREAELQRLRAVAIAQAVTEAQQRAELEAQQRAALAQVLGTPGQPAAGPVQPGMMPLTRGGSGLMAATSPGGQQISRDELIQAAVQNAATIGPENAQLLGSLANAYRQTPEELAANAYASETGRRQGELATMTPTEAASIARAQASQANDLVAQSFNQEKELRNQFVKGSSNYITVRDAYGRVKVSARNPSAAGDLSMIFAYMKLLDPTSVVREGEFATAQNSGSIPQTIQAQYNKVLSGERLAPEQRQDFVKRAGEIYNVQLRGQQQLEREYSRLAHKYGLDKNSVVVDLQPNRFTYMGADELKNVDLNSLSDSELQKYLEVLNGR